MSFEKWNWCDVRVWETDRELGLVSGRGVHDLHSVFHDSLYFSVLVANFTCSACM